MSDLKIEDLITDFEFFDNWEDKYKYIIELGKNCPSLNENEKNNDNKVDGCASQVWLITKKEKLNDKIILKFKGDSDALIVKGLVVILFSIYAWGRAFCSNNSLFYQVTIKIYCSSGIIITWYWKINSTGI